MTSFIVDIVEFAFFANLALFGLVYAFVILPRLGDREIKVRPSLWEILGGGYLGKQFAACEKTLDGADRRRWHQRYLRAAVPVQVILLVCMIVLQL